VNAKAVPIVSTDASDISTIANYILHASADIANAALEDTAKLASVGVFDAGNAISVVASILNEASAIVNIAVSDSTGVVGSSLGAVTGSTTVPSNAPYGPPILVLPTSSFMLNISSLASAISSSGGLNYSLEISHYTCCNVLL
jgi:hypothetical protein